jgi:hypothetical protein
MAAMYERGKTTHEIAAQFATNSGTVSYHFKRMGVKCKSRSDAARKHHFRQDAFSSIRDEAAAYWLGFLYADGSVCVRRGGTEKQLRVFLKGSDRLHLERLADWLGASALVKEDRRYGTVGVSLYSGRLVDDLISLGCVPRKSLEPGLDMPTEHVPSTLIHHFIRGYFDGDGSAHAGGGSPVLNFCGDPSFLAAVEGIILVGAGVSGTTFAHSRSKRVVYLVYRGIGKLRPVSEWLYEGATVWLPRKRERVDLYVSTAGHVSDKTIANYIAAQETRSG